jgi:hypothetical protein
VKRPVAESNEGGVGGELGASDSEGESETPPSETPLSRTFASGSASVSDASSRELASVFPESLEAPPSDTAWSPLSADGADPPPVLEEKQPAARLAMAMVARFAKHLGKKT